MLIREHFTRIWYLGKSTTCELHENKSPVLLCVLFFQDRVSLGPTEAMRALQDAGDSHPWIQVSGTSQHPWRDPEPPASRESRAYTRPSLVPTVIPQETVLIFTTSGALPVK